MRPDQMYVGQSAAPVIRRYLLPGGQEIHQDAVIKSRLWKGDDAVYLNLIIDQQAYRDCPVRVGTVLYTDEGGGAQALTKWAIREISMQAASHEWQVSCIDEWGWQRMTQVPGTPLVPLPEFMPKPPRFATVEEADAWLEQHG